MSEVVDIKEAFNGLCALIDGGHFAPYPGEEDKAKEVLRRICLLNARRPEETLVCEHNGHGVYFPRTKGSGCPICHQPKAQ